MRRSRLLLGIATALLLAAQPSGSAFADIIDFDPRTDGVPDILTPDELTKYDQLRGGLFRPSVSTVSPDGRYVIVTVPEGPRILEVGSQTFHELTFNDGWAVVAPSWWISDPGMALYTWISDTEVVAYAHKIENRQVVDHAKLTLDVATRRYETASFPMPAVEGRTLSIYNGLHKLGDGSLNLLARTVTDSRPPLEFVPPTYDARSPAERAVTGDAIEPVRILQTPEKVVLISIEDGALTEVASIPPGTNLGGLLGSFSTQSTGNMASYVTSSSYSWVGKIINGRSARGGGMPTGFFNTREALGLVEAADNPHMTQTQLHLVNLSTGEDQVIENAEHGPEKFVDTLWTAVGEHLLVISSMPGQLAGRLHPEYEYPIGQMIKRFTPDGTPNGSWHAPGFDSLATTFRTYQGSELLAVRPAGTTRHVYRVDVVDDAAVPVPLYTGVGMLVAPFLSLSWGYGGGTFLASIETAAAPADLFLGESPSGERFEDFAPLTTTNAAREAVGGMATVPFSYRTSAGYDLTGTYVYPAAWSFPPEEPQPAVVWQQGGPGGQMYNMWGASVESPYSLLPAFGVPVIIVNGSGRTSDGAQFYADMADGTNFGQRDIRDVKEAVDHLVGLGVVDPEAVGVTGCSYGGYFTLQSLVELPDFYAAGNSQCSLNDMMYEYHFGWAPFLAYLIGSAPTMDPAEYVKDSPAFRAGEIRSPLLQFHGTNDFLFFESITNIHDQVQANGVPSRFFRARGYGHGLGGSEGDNGGVKAQRYAFQLQLQWFREHLFGQRVDVLSLGDLLPLTRSLRPGAWIGEVGR